MFQKLRGKGKSVNKVLKNDIKDALSYKTMEWV